VQGVDEPRGTEAFPAVVFDALWGSMTDTLGAGATSTVIRRALKRASAKHPALAHVIIAREGLDYRYSLPADWQTASPEAALGLCALVAELFTILEELTGPVMLRRLAEIPGLLRYVASKVEVKP
jgi:hypothetical protein